MIDVLQQGGAGPRSRPDPADGHTRYFLHDHDGSLDYAWSRYGGSTTLALEYVASHPDLINALGADARGGQLHFERMGSIEQRAITFDSIDYIASYTDLVSAFGADGAAGAAHFITAGSPRGPQRHLQRPRLHRFLRRPDRRLRHRRGRGGLHFLLPARARAARRRSMAWNTSPLTAI